MASNKINVISVGMAGVDMKTNPLFLDSSNVQSATNLQFDEGVIKTRHGFEYHDLGTSGKYRGGAAYSPSRGLSHQPFADPIVSLVYGVDNTFYYNIMDCGEPMPPIELCGKNVDCRDEVYLYQAENYLIAQSRQGATWWWEGSGCYTVSLGLSAPQELVQELCCEIIENKKELVLDKKEDECCFYKMDVCELEAVPQEDWLHSSHDSLCNEKHRHFLMNSAGLGAYVHGRIHQEGHNVIAVSDIIHKRGHKLTDDILLMEEQQLASYGDPLSTNSKLGQLRALYPLPAMSTANGEGDLIAYYDNGAVAYNTFQLPREARYDAEGNQIQEGWGDKRMVSHLLNVISAVGRYAVAVLPRDHAFRSKFGVHFLRLVLGTETLRDESVNTFSQNVQPILDSDDASQLRGAAVGHWVKGSRVLTTTGLHPSFAHSASPMGKGFVVFNQASSYTQDRTPRPVWEGLWLMDNGMQGIHQFLNAQDPISYDTFGFMCSDRDTNLFFAEPRPTLSVDKRNGKTIPIEWQVTSAQHFMRDLGQLKHIGEGRLEVIFNDSLQNVRVWIRTDQNTEWKIWNEFSGHEDIKRGEKVLRNFVLGKPDVDYSRASWYQFKVEGVGHVEIRQLEVTYSNDTGKSGRDICSVVDSDCNNFFEYNDKPLSDRWL